MKTKKGEMTIETVIALVLVLLVIVVVLIFIFKPQIWDYIRNLPGYNYEENDTIITNIGEDELKGIGCNKLIGRLGEAEGVYGFRLSYIFIGGFKSNLHYNEKTGEIKLRQGFKDILAGRIENNKVFIEDKFLDEESLSYLKYKYNKKDGSGLPGIRELQALDGSRQYFDGSYLCKSEEEIEWLKEEKLCIENCSLYNGNCKENCEKGEVSYGNLDCGKIQCCIKEKEEKLNDKELLIEKFAFYNPKKNGEIKLENNEINVLSGESSIFVIGISYFKSQEIPYSKPFCYIVRTDKAIINKGYFRGKGLSPLGENTNIKGFNFNWIAGDENSFEFIAFVPKDSKKAHKRIKVIPNNQGENFVNDKDFLKSINYLNNGNSFYVFLANGFIFSKEVYIEKFWIEKSGNRISIFAYDKSRNRKKEWHELDCGKSNPLRKTAPVRDLSESLSETLSKSCKW